MQRTTTTTRDAKQAYANELEAMRSKLEQINNQLLELVGDGSISERVNWANVGDLTHLNHLLDEAIAFHVPHIE